MWLGQALAGTGGRKKVEDKKKNHQSILSLSLDTKYLGAANNSLKF